MDYQLGILGFIAVALLVVDRVMRINPLLNKLKVGSEGFKVNTGTGSMIAGKRCGVDLFPCGGNLRCGNGMCISQKKTMPIETYPLPVYP